MNETIKIREEIMRYKIIQRSGSTKAKVGPLKT